MSVHHIVLFSLCYGHFLVWLLENGEQNEVDDAENGNMCGEPAQHLSACEHIDDIEN